ncbi:MAG: hypothetical protein H6867_02260 [Rhodospirillales bacterium]|nr:hypothetical protein [Rhodospirillales bacterium]MCB9997011.1 hypothetical protein [Rhodospirillales bacterium]
MNDQTNAHAGRRMTKLTALALIILFSGVFLILFLIPGPARSMELDHPSSVIDTDETPLPIIISPEPVQQYSDTCLSLLKSVRYTASPSAMDRDRHVAGKAAALGVVFGVRFALGPKEVARSGGHNKAVRFDLWEARESNSRQAMAVAEYRRCKNEEALKAISDWRWKR